MKKTPPLASLLMMMPFAAITALLFTPALPSIADNYGISSSIAAFAITVFLFGYALGNLPYGPFAKRFGRKPTLYLGVFISLLGIFLILLSEKFLSFDLFLLGRFLTAIGSTAGMKIAFTMIADSFNGARATQIISLCSLSFAIAPSLSVVIGGALTTHFHWTYCFYALALYNLLILILGFRLPETAPYLDPSALNISQMLKSYRKKFGNQQLVLSALTMGTTTSIIYLFSTFAPFIAIQTLKTSPETFGFFNLIPPIGQITGCLAASKLASKKSSFHVLSIGLVMVTLATLCLWTLFFLRLINMWTLFLPIPFLYFGTSLVFNNATSLSLETVSDKSNGSAVMSFINIGLATTSVLSSSFFKGLDPIILPSLYLILVALMWILRMRLQKITRPS